jgi:putative endonuclease
MNNNLLGAFGEQEAARYLRREGYMILAANYETYVGELDIVAQKGKCLCFVEVKTRTEGGINSPADAVDGRKRDNIRGSASAYMNACSLNMKYRFDIIEVFVRDEKVVKINHIKNAF